MTETLFKDDAFTLEATKDEFNNIRLKQVFTQGEHVDIDEILLSPQQQHALKEYLSNLLK